MNQEPPADPIAHITDRALLGRASKLATQNKGQISARGYAYIGHAILQIERPRVLVFGLGRDSEFWKTCAGQDGRCVFLESDPRFIKRAIETLTKPEIFQVDYGPETIQDWTKLLKIDADFEPTKNQEPGTRNPVSVSAPSPRLRLDLPLDITEEVWDVIIVDAPTGYASTNPGRMKPLAMVGSAIHSGCPINLNDQAHVFVHDIDRDVEAIYAAWFFRPPDWRRVTQFDRLRHYMTTR